MAQAYDFALDKVGLDINSFSIWTDYIIFLKNVYVISNVYITKVGITFDPSDILFIFYSGRQWDRTQRTSASQPCVRSTNAALLTP